MPSSDPVMRLLRVMTHVNIGAVLGLVAWLAGSGWQVVSGGLRPPEPAPFITQAAQVAIGPAGSRALCLRPIDPSRNAPTPSCGGGAGELSPQEADL